MKWETYFHPVSSCLQISHWNPQGTELSDSKFWSNLSWSVFFAASTQTLSPSRWWRDEGEDDDRCVAVFATGWLVNAVWSAKWHSGSEIRKARAMRSFDLVNLTEHTPIPCLSCHISVSFIIITMYHEPSSVLHMLRLPYPVVWNYHPASTKGKQENTSLFWWFINGASL